MPQGVPATAFKTTLALLLSTESQVLLDVAPFEPLARSGSDSLCSTWRREKLHNKS
jgi:hypothetical protein